MPAKKRKNVISDAERSKRIRETAREISASDDPKVAERALKKIAPPRKRG
jgi:hypothetical protein